MSEKKQIYQAIQDYRSIMDFKDKEQVAWCRKEITILKKELRKLSKGENN